MDKEEILPFFVNGHTNAQLMAELKKTDSLLSEQKLQLERLRFEREKLGFEKKKIGQLTVIVTVVALFVSGLQVWVALKQHELAEAQTFERYIPHLLNSSSKDLALTTMKPFVNRTVVTELAAILKSTETLEDLKQEDDIETRKEAESQKWNY